MVADDHKIMRDGLRTLIEKEPGMEVVGDAEDGREALKRVRELKPDVVIMDVTMPNLNGIEATRQIAANLPEVKVIALSMHNDRLFVERMLLAGASGYLTKDCALEELARAIRTVTDDKTYLSPNVAGVVIDGYKKLRMSPEGSSAFFLLTPREREVLQLLAEGKSTKQTAAALHVSVKTVETHRRQIMIKLGMKSIAEPPSMR